MSYLLSDFSPSVLKIDVALLAATFQRLRSGSVYVIKNSFRNCKRKMKNSAIFGSPWNKRSSTRLLGAAVPFISDQIWHISRYTLEAGTETAY